MLNKEKYIIQEHVDFNFVKKQVHWLKIKQIGLYWKKIFKRNTSKY